MNAPWFVNNNTIHNVHDGHCEEIKRVSTNYLNILSTHRNVLAISLLETSNVRLALFIKM